MNKLRDKSPQRLSVATTRRLDDMPMNTEDELSLDTRIAAQAIFNEESIGRVVEPRTMTSAEPSQFNWAHTHRIGITLFTIAIGISVAILPILLDSSERSTAEELKTVIKTQAIFMGQKLGHQKMEDLVAKRDLRTIKEFYLDVRPAILQKFGAEGHSVTEKQLKLRLDGKRKTILLGVQYDQGDFGPQIVWASAKGDDSERETTSSGTMGIIASHDNLLVIIVVSEALILSFLWLIIPILRRRTSSA